MTGGLTEEYHAPDFKDGIDPYGSSQIRISISGVAAQTPALSQGWYYVWVTVDCYTKVAPVANDVTGATNGGGLLHRTGNTDLYWIREGHKIGAITGGAAGSLGCHKVG